MAVSFRRGKWVLDFYDQTGKRRWVTTRWSAPEDKDRAVKHLAKLEQEVAQGAYRSARQQVHLAKLIEAYMAQLDVRTLTKRDYETIIANRLAPFFGLKRKLNSITRLDIERYRAEQQKAGLAVATINKDLVLISMLLKYAQANG